MSAGEPITDLTQWRAAHGFSTTLWCGPTWGAAPAVQMTATNPGRDGRQRVEVQLRDDGPHVSWAGGNPDDLWVMAQALLDGARAARNGDDINDVVQQEWRRRGGRPELD